MEQSKKSFPVLPVVLAVVVIMVICGCLAFSIIPAMLLNGAPDPGDIDEATLRPTSKPHVTIVELEDVCINQEPIEDAAPYDPTPGEISPVAVTVKGDWDWVGYDLQDDYAGMSTSDLEDRHDDWQPESDYSVAQLIACVEVTDREEIETCEYNFTNHIIRYRTTYKVTLYETATAKRVASGTLTTDAEECPNSEVFPGGTEKYMDGTLPGALDDFLEEYVAP